MTHRLATDRARAHRIAKAADIEQRMVKDDICAGMLLRCKKQGPALPKAEPVRRKINWPVFGAPHYQQAARHLASLPPERRAFLQEEWK